MIVDDNNDLVDLVKNILIRENYDTMEAYSGIECLNKIKLEKPDLILLDIMMKPIDGWETLEKIKQDGDLKNIPVSMLTVIPLSPEIMRTKDIENIENYIVKPFSKKDLLLKVREILDETATIKRESKILQNEIGVDVAGDLEELKKKIERHSKLMIVLKNYSARDKNSVSSTKAMLELEERRINQWKRQLEEIKNKIGIK